MLKAAAAVAFAALNSLRSGAEASAFTQQASSSSTSSSEFSTSTDSSYSSSSTHTSTSATSRFTPGPDWVSAVSGRCYQAARDEWWGTGISYTICFDGNGGGSVTQQSGIDRFFVGALGYSGFRVFDISGGDFCAPRGGGRAGTLVAVCAWGASAGSYTANAEEGPVCFYKITLTLPEACLLLPPGPRAPPLPPRPFPPPPRPPPYLEAVSASFLVEFDAERVLITGDDSPVISSLSALFDLGARRPRPLPSRWRHRRIVPACRACPPHR